MYSYIYDSDTGGLLLTSSASYFSREPRPVYAQELDILEFNKIWQYEKQNEFPYMWAEANSYWYRGKKVAQIIGGNLNEKPKIILLKDQLNEYLLPSGSHLTQINIEGMIDKNLSILTTIEKATKKRIYDFYYKNKYKFNCYRIAFSGGKDSIVLLDLVINSIPHTNLLVMFGDTGMEFPDTYDLVKLVEHQCVEEGIPFYCASSHMEAETSWKIFGPPSRILRWCCSVHKAVPQALKMKQIMGGKKFNELVFVGVRASESELRSKYDFVIKNKKVKNQTTYNGILDWNSAEIWLYIYWKKLPINRAYKIGNQRVGCLYCPMSLKSDYIKNKIYHDKIIPFINIVKEHFDESDLINGYWCARANGSLLKENKQKIFEFIDKNFYTISLNELNSNLEVWLKTIESFDFQYIFTKNENGYLIKIPISDLYIYRQQISHFKNILYKSAFCVGCRLCEVNCPNGSIHFSNGVHISDCNHCQSCNSQDYGCLLYNSRRFPTIRGISQMKNVIDIFATHAPKTEWLSDFFNKKNDFIKSNNLGPEQITRFKRFLKEAVLINNSGVTDFANFISNLQWNSEISLGLVLINLSACNQIFWYIKNLPIGQTYSRQYCLDLLHSQGYREIASKNVVAAFKRFCELPFGKILHFGRTDSKGKILETLCRTKTVPPDPRVFLYGLYKFAEACEGYYQFTLGRLMDFTVESKGVGPAEIFGLSRDETEQYLHGLAQEYPEFVLSFSTTHGLELVNLNPEKTSADVLSLF